MRRSEALGLHWADVDFEGPQVTVRWQVVDAGRGLSSACHGSVLAREYQPGVHPARAGCDLSLSLRTAMTQ
jgi:hypothetical protein